MTTTLTSLVSKKKPVAASIIAKALKVNPKIARARLRRAGQKSRGRLVAPKDIKRVASIMSGKAD